MAVIAGDVIRRARRRLADGRGPAEVAPEAARATLEWVETIYGRRGLADGRGPAEVAPEAARATLEWIKTIYGELVNELDEEPDDP
jgi:hypothetical protein